MIQGLSQRTNKNGDLIKTYLVQSSTVEQLATTTKIKVEYFIANSVLKYIKIVPLSLMPEALDAFVFEFPDGPGDLTALVNNADPVIWPLLGPPVINNGICVQISSNKDFQGLQIPIYKELNGRVVCNFQAIRTDQPEASMYLVEFYTSKK